MNYEEYKLSVSIAKYLDTWKKDILFQFTNDAIKLNAIQASRKKALRQKRGYPDLFIPESTDKYSGLYIELKKSKNQIYGKKGQLLKNKHLKEQIAMHEQLKKRGYKVVFCWSLDGFIKVLEEYLTEK